MTQTALLVALFAFMFAAFRELSEHGKEGGFIGWANWWNTPLSSTNKHSWGPDWLPKWVFGSALVWLTDAEHFFQFLSLLCLLAIVFILGGWQMALVAYLSQAFAGFLKIFTPIK